jgi:hypothetical protein
MDPHVRNGKPIRARCGSLGVPYDVANPTHGGYRHITPQEWANYDAEMADRQLTPTGHTMIVN